MERGKKLTILRNLIYTYYLYAGKSIPEVAEAIAGQETEKETLVELCNTDPIMKQVKTYLTNLDSYYREPLINACCNWWQMNFFLLPEVALYGYRKSDTKNSDILPAVLTNTMTSKEDMYGLVLYTEHGGTALRVEASQHTGSMINSHSSGSKWVADDAQIHSVYSTIINFIKAMPDHGITSMVKESPFTLIRPSTVLTEDLIKLKMKEALETLDSDGAGLLEALDLNSEDWRALFHSRRMPEYVREIFNDWVDTKVASMVVSIPEEVAVTEA